MNEWVRYNGCPWNQDTWAPSFLASSGFNAPSTTHSFTPHAPSQTPEPSPTTPSPLIPLSTARISAVRNHFCLQKATRHQFICLKPNPIKDGRLLFHLWVVANKMRPAWAALLANYFLKRELQPVTISGMWLSSSAFEARWGCWECAFKHPRTVIGTRHLLGEKKKVFFPCWGWY